MRHRALAIGLAVAAVVAACDGGEEPLAGPETLTATPVVSSPVPSATETVSAGPTGTPSPTEPSPHDPTDADRARFVAGYRPGGTSDHRNVAVDLDGDGVQEIVFGFVVDGEHRTQVDVASWLGTRYEITAAEAGGPADDLSDLQVRDVNGDQVTDIVLVQTVGASGMSATLWRSAGPGRIAPLAAVGDCFDGSNTYGDTGVRISDRDGDGADEIAATCEDPDRPQPLWPTVIYDWNGEAYTCDHRETADGLSLPCEGGRGGGGGTTDG